MTRHAIVTGASRGIGRAIAIGLANRGYNLALNDIPLQEAALLETIAEVKKLGGQCIPVLADVSNVGDCQRVVSEAVQGLGHVDGNRPKPAMLRPRLFSTPRIRIEFGGRR